MNTLSKLAEFKFILIILLIMVGVMTAGDLLPLDIKRGAFTFSSLIRVFLMFFLPFLVFPFIVNGISMLRSNGLFFLISLIVLITVSNFTSILIGGQFAAIIVPNLNLSMTFNLGDAQELMTFFDFEIEPLISIEFILLFGFVIGFILSIKPNERILSFFEAYKNLSTKFFEKIFIPLLPIYILGTLLKLDVENDFAIIFKDFGAIIVMIALVQIFYIFFVFFVGSKYSLKKVVEYYRNTLPAGLLGFSTMSSLVTMPITLEATEKNLKDKPLARIIITSTVNCHVIGECISLSVIAMSIYLIANGMVLPDISTCIHLAFILAIAQFTAVSVPGGGVVVLIPLVTKYFGFSPEMIGLLTTLSIFMDPLGTTNNIFGNSAFALIVQRYFNFATKKLRLKKAQEISSVTQQHNKLAKHQKKPIIRS